MVVVGAVIRRDGRILACQRSRVGSFPLKWEFAGGKVEAAETPKDALARELREELGIEARIGEEIWRTKHKYAEMREEIELIFFDVREIEGEIENRVFEAVEWVDPAWLTKMDFLPADRELIERLAAEGRAASQS